MEKYEILKAITLYQPWATWIMWGWKRIETRLHDKYSWLKGKRIVIHAGMKYDKDAIYAAKQFMTDAQISLHQNFASTKSYPAGVALGTVYVHDARPLNKDDSGFALIDCEYTLRNGLFLRDVKQFERPVVVSGSQGIWDCFVYE